MAKRFSFHYDFRFQDDDPVRFSIDLDREELTIRNEPVPNAPSWLRLDFEKCPNCTLPSTDGAVCPAARAVSAIFSKLPQKYSYEPVEVTVHSPERVYSKMTTMQVALSSLLGIQLAASGCPVAGRLRPLVRFHLPFASPEETLFRAVTMYLLCQYLGSQEGVAPDWSLQTLSQAYRSIELMNRSFARRLRTAAETDANINALSILDVFAKTLPDSIESQLEELRYLYRSWTNANDAAAPMPPSIAQVRGAR